MGRRLLLVIWYLIIVPFLIQIARMLIVVAVNAQQLSIAAVRGIVVVVVVSVMNREFTKSLALEVAAAPRTHLLAVAFGCS